MHQLPQKLRKTPRASIVFSLLLIVFITEVAVMELLAPLLPRLNPIPASIVDAAILTVVYAIPLLLMVTGPASRRGSVSPASRRSRSTFCMSILAAIFFAELLVMLLLSYAMPGAGSITRSLVDALLTALIAAPVLWWILAQQQEAAFRDLYSAPLKLYVLVLGTVFALDLLEAEFVPLLFPAGPPVPYRFYDAFVTTLFTAPFLWWLMVRPLQKAAMIERIRHETIQAQVVDAIVTIDLHGLIISCNSAAEEIFGYAPDEISGSPAAILFCDDLLSLEKLAELTDGREGSRVTHEVSCRRKDGQAVTLEISVSKMQLQESAQYLVIMRDISQRKAAEKALRESEIRFRQIFEQSADAILFFSRSSCTIIDVNNTAELLFGYSKAELQANGPDCLASGSDQLRTFVRGIQLGGMPHLDRLAARQRDGTELLLSVRGRIMVLQGVEIICCTFRDITQRVRLEAQSREIQAKLIQANKMTSLGLMVSGVAHEINNPNNFILANAQLLERVWGDALLVLREYHQEHGNFLLGGLPFAEMEQHVPEMLTGIIDGARRINGIIGDLKGFVREDRRTALRAIDVNQTVRSAVAILQSQLITYTERFRLELDEELPLIQGNSQQLGQVIINLLMNACQALPDRNCSVSLITGFDRAANQVIVAVSDEGEGVPPEAGQRIMEPFFTTKLDAGGTGLGLSISRAIIKEHHGTLDFVSNPGAGTTFTIRLPAVAAVVKESM